MYDFMSNIILCQKKLTFAGFTSVIMITKSFAASWRQAAVLSLLSFLNVCGVCHNLKIF